MVAIGEESDPPRVFGRCRLGHKDLQEASKAVLQSLAFGGGAQVETSPLRHLRGGLS